VVTNSLGHSIAQFPMVVDLGFLLPSFIAKSPYLAVGGMAPLVVVASLPTMITITLSFNVGGIFSTI
jgi:hypothetical protein